jgi:biopolymer transport protein ExbD
MADPSSHPGAVKSKPELNIAPLIDVVFLLLVFFLLTSSSILNQLDLHIAGPRPPTRRCWATCWPPASGSTSPALSPWTGSAFEWRICGPPWPRRCAPGAGERPFVVRAAPDTPVALLVRVLDEMRAERSAKLASRRDAACRKRREAMMIRSPRKLRGKPSLAPLIDVVFLLLIFFLLTSTLITSDRYEVELPPAAHGQDENDNAVVILVNQSGRYAVNNQSVPLEQLLPALEAALEGASRREVTIKADGRATAKRCGGGHADRNGGGSRGAGSSRRPRSGMMPALNFFNLSVAFLAAALLHVGGLAGLAYLILPQTVRKEPVLKVSLAPPPPPAASAPQPPESQPQTQVLPVRIDAPRLVEESQVPDKKALEALTAPALRARPEQGVVGGVPGGSLNGIVAQLVQGIPRVVPPPPAPAAASPRRTGG